MAIADPERFKNIAAGVQSWALSVAVVVGGGWTLYTFVAPQAQLNIKVEAHQERSPDCDLCIAAIAEVTNTGRRNVLLNYKDGPFFVAKVSMTGNGTSSIDEEREIRQGNYGVASRVLRTGETVWYPFLTRVQDPGSYMVRVRIPLPGYELPRHTAAGGPSNEAIVWDGAAIVNVVRTNTQ